MIGHDIPHRAVAKMREWVALCVGCNERKRIWCEGKDGEHYCRDCGEKLYDAAA